MTSPVTELVTAALKADEGQLPAADAEALKAKIAAAVDEAKAAAPAPLPDAPVTPPSTDLPVTPPAELPVTPPAVETPVDLPAKPPVEAPALPVKPPVGLPVAAGAKAAWAGKTAAPADVVDDALATVEKAVAALLAAVTSGNAGGVVPQVTATLTSLVNLAVATVLGSGLPAPDLAGLPSLPSLPVTAPELPVDPPELPVDPPVKPRSTCPNCRSSRRCRSGSRPVVIRAPDPARHPPGRIGRVRSSHHTGPHRSGAVSRNPSSRSFRGAHLSLQKQYKAQVSVKRLVSYVT